jgi:hypothetical protein
MVMRSRARRKGEDPPPFPKVPIEVALPRVEPLVRDSLEKLEQYAIPLFQRVTEHRGVPWPKDEKRSAGNSFVNIEDEARFATAQILKTLTSANLRCDRKVGVGQGSEIDNVVTAGGKSAFVVTTFSLGLVWVNTKTGARKVPGKDYYLKDAAEVVQRLKNAVNRAKPGDIVILYVVIEPTEWMILALRDALGVPPEPTDPVSRERQLNDALSDPLSAAVCGKVQVVHMASDLWKVVTAALV